jgi:hypothetical protein
MANNSRDMILRPRMVWLGDGDRRGDFRLDRSARRIVLARATQETCKIAADCNSRRFDRLVESIQSLFDFLARDIVRATRRF